MNKIVAKKMPQMDSASEALPRRRALLTSPSEAELWAITEITKNDKNTDYTDVIAYKSNWN